MGLRRVAVALATSLAVSAACTSSGRPGPSAASTPGRPVLAAGAPSDITGDSPFRGCPATGEIAVDTEVEPSLAVDPGDPRRLVAAWQQDRNTRGGAQGIATARSTDGGRTWRRTAPPRITRCAGGRYALASDPVVSIGADHVYLSAIGIEVSGSGRDRRVGTDVIVAASADGGDTWGDPAIVASSGDNELVSLDKETVLADPRLPGTAYAVWVQYTNPSPQREARTNATFFSRTSDGGRTWSMPIKIHEANTESQFHQLVELADGTLLDAFIEAPSLSNRPPFAARISVLRSSDRGVTWSGPATAAQVSFTEVVDPTGKAHVRGTGQGILAAAGPDDVAYVAWTEPRRTAPSLIAVARSDDGGRSWGPPTTVAHERSQPFIPAVAVAGNGWVGIEWYEVPSEQGGTELPCVVRFAWSADRGVTWRFLRLAGPFDLHTADLTTGGDFVGDYQGLVGLPRGFAALNALAKPDSRSGATDLFFSVVGAGH